MRAFVTAASTRAVSPLLLASRVLHRWAAARGCAGVSKIRVASAVGRPAPAFGIPYERLQDFFGHQELHAKDAPARTQEEWTVSHDQHVLEPGPSDGTDHASLASQCVGMCALGARVRDHAAVCMLSTQSLLALAEANLWLMEHGAPVADTNETPLRLRARARVWCVCVWMWM